MSKKLATRNSVSGGGWIKGGLKFKRPEGLGEPEKKMAGGEEKSSWASDRHHFFPGNRGKEPFAGERRREADKKEGLEGSKRTQNGKLKQS